MSDASTNAPKPDNTLHTKFLKEFHADYLGENQEIVGERRVNLKRIRIKEYPDQADEMFKQTGRFGTPLNVLAILEIIHPDGEEEHALWPVNIRNGTTGMWFACDEDWQKDEDEFKRLLAEEMERLKYVTKEKRGVGV